MTFSSILIIKLGKFQNKICFENKKKTCNIFFENMQKGNFSFPYMYVTYT